MDIALTRVLKKRRDKGKLHHRTKLLAQGRALGEPKGTIDIWVRYFRISRSESRIGHKVGISATADLSDII